jgi:hypothetical protein
MIKTLTADHATRGIVCGLSLLLAMPAVAAGPVLKPNEPTPVTLSISTDPSGARVYVDGRLSGVTPLSLDRLEPGDHRLRVTKDGYLENARVITIGSQRPNALRLTLTPRTATPIETPAPAATQISRGGGTDSDTTSGGPLHNPLFLVSFAGLGVGAAAALIQNNVLPRPGTFSVTPENNGIAGVTEFQFSATGAIDYDDDPLTYNWNFGDGRSGTGATVQHVFTPAPGAPSNASVSYTTRLTVSDGQHEVPVGSRQLFLRPPLTGTWGNALDPIFSCPFTLTLVQTGRALSGSIVFSGACTGSALLQSGTTSSSTYPTTVTWQTSPFTLTYAGDVQTGLSLFYQGTTNVTGTTMNGPLAETQPGTFTPPATTNFIKQ